MSKITLRIPCKEPYAYVEKEFEENTPIENIKMMYDRLYALMNGKGDSTGLITPNTAFYEYLVALIDSNLTKWGSADTYEKWSDEEKSVVQSAKRYSKRLSNKE